MLGFADATSFNKWIYRRQQQLLKDYGISTTGDGKWTMNSAAQNDSATPSTQSFESAPSRASSSFSAPPRAEPSAAPISAAPKKAIPIPRARPAPAQVPAPHFAIQDPQDPQSGPRRHVFLIGNSDYQPSFGYAQENDPPGRRRGLTDVSGVTDARLLFGTLQDSFGFQGDFATDLSMDTIHSNVEAFWDSTGDDDTVLFYFSGHAEYIPYFDGRPSLCLYGTEGNPYPLDLVLHRQVKRAGVLIVILDTCDPSKQQTSQTHLDVSLPPRTFVIYSSTDTKETATGSGWEKMSPYTEHLRETLMAIHEQQTSMSIEEISKCARKLVYAHSDGNILPVDATTFIDDFYL